MLLIGLAVCTLSIQAEVIEKNVKLPDGLGEGVIYTNTDTTQAGPGVIVVHEWWGLNDYARSRARQLAGLGYSAIAVDMYGTGKVAQHPDDAKAFMQAAFAESDKMNARFNAAKTLLSDLESVDAKKIYAIGYCFGGGVVLDQARQGNDLAGVASFHGMLGTDEPAQKDKVKARILVATGAADPYVPTEQVVAFVQEMTNAEAEFELLSFPGVLHSFTDVGATEKGKKFGMPAAYDENADQVSWAALLQMLQQ
ncbi:MAG: dienelactone hydrolase family protein [Haliea sp.]|nr:dienelactone hydrolase family protein [Haliea sp.]